MMCVFVGGPLVVVGEIIQIGGVIAERLGPRRLLMGLGINGLLLLLLRRRRLQGLRLLLLQGLRLHGLRLHGLRPSVALYCRRAVSLFVRRPSVHLIASTRARNVKRIVSSEII